MIYNFNCNSLVLIRTFIVLFLNYLSNIFDELDSSVWHSKQQMVTILYQPFSVPPRYQQVGRLRSINSLSLWLWFGLQGSVPRKLGRLKSEWSAGAIDLSFKGESDFIKYKIKYVINCLNVITNLIWVPVTERRSVTTTRGVECHM